MGFEADKILKIFKRLLPTGRAFRMFPDGWMEKIFKGLATGQEQAYKDAIAILNVIIPDNASFTTDDATDWERRLGMTTNGATPLDDRKAAILRKMGFPGINPARGNYKYIEGQLQAAGFNVSVYENIPVQDPAVLNAAIFGNAQFDDFQFKGTSFGGYVNHVLANSIDNEVDIEFDPGQNLKCVFFVGGSPLGTDTNLPASREQEFRKLLLMLKPTHNIAYLYLNFI